jgi:type VI secretion system protein VasI
MPFAVFGLVLPVLVATKQDLGAEIAKCAAVESDLARLTCFDQIAVLLAAKGAPEPNPSPVDSNWRVEISADPLTDSKTVLLALVADGKNAMLILRCKNAKAEVFINWNNYLGSEAVVTTRVGTSAASQQQWGLSTDKKATFYPRNSFQLIEELTRVDKFVAQVTPYNESPVTALFDVSGLADAAGPFFETCKSK